MNSFLLPHFEINPISERDAWRLCDFISSNEEHLRRFFPGTLAANLTPTLSEIFVEQKVLEFSKGEEFLFTLKEPEHRKIIGLIYVKEIDKDKKEAELAYCIGYSNINRGFTSLGVKTISEWAFSKPYLDTLRIIVHKSNIGSLKVAQNCGYLWTETLKKAHTPPGELALDMELYILKK